MLGVKRTVSVSPDRIKADTDRAIRYSQSSDYTVFAKEVWADVLDSMDKLMRSDLSDREIDFHRGRMNASLDHLRISYKARQMKEKILSDDDRLKKK